MPTEINDIRELIRKAIEQPGSEFPQLSEKRKEMQTAFQELAKITDQFYAKKEDGSYPVLNEDEKKNLLTCYKNTINAVDNYQEGLRDIFGQQEEKNEVADTLSNLMNRIQDVLGKDVNKLLSLNAQNKSYTLPDAIQNARIKKVDFSNQPIAKTGGMLSSRLRIKFRSTDGEMMDGYFTKSNPKTTRDEEMRAAYKRLKTRVSNNIDSKTLQTVVNEIVGHLSKYRSGSVSEFLDTAYTGGKSGINQNTHCSPEHIFDRFISSKTLADEKKQKLFNGTGLSFEITDFLKELEQIKNKYSIMKTAGIESNQSTDSRNSAMTSVALLLDMDGLIAHSEPMEVIDSDGKTIKGTFMQTAKGSDCNPTTGNDIFGYANLRKRESVTLRKQLADLQILDYICGNIDRHLGNMLYNFDRTKLESDNLVTCTGIQGIDNDSSFGTIKGGGIQSLPSLEDIGVITEKTAMTLLNITPAVLKTVLRNHNLSEKELEAAQIRMEKVKNAVRNHTIYVVKEEKWKDLDTSVYPNGYHENVKYLLHDAENELADTMKEKTEQNYRKHFKDFSKLKDTLVAMDTLMQDADKNVWNGSSEFKAVKNGCEKMLSCYKSAMEKPTTSTFTNMRKAYESALRNAKAYVQKKAQKPDLNDKEKKRLKAVKTFLDTSEVKLSVIGMVEKNCLEKDQTEKWKSRSFAQIKEDYVEVLRKNVNKYPEGSKAKSKGVCAVKAVEELTKLAGDNRVFDIETQKTVSKHLAEIYNYDPNLMIRTELGYGYGNGAKPKMGSSIDLLLFLNDVHTYEKIKAPNMSRQVKEDMKMENAQENQVQRQANAAAKREQKRSGMNNLNI